MTINEEHPGFDAAALKHLRTSLEKDIKDGKYDGVNLILSRDGKVGMDVSLGYAHRDSGRLSKPEDVYWIFSMTKAFTNFLVLQAIDRGQMAFTDRVVDYIPEFNSGDRFRQAKKEQISIVHLLTHRAGLVTTPSPLPYDQLGNLSNVIKAICELDVVGTPGQRDFLWTQSTVSTVAFQVEMLIILRHSIMLLWAKWSDEQREVHPTPS